MLLEAMFETKYHAHAGMQFAGMQFAGLSIGRNGMGPSKSIKPYISME